MQSIINVNEMTSPELQWYLTRSEVQLLRAREPAPGYFIAESPNVIRRALHAGYEPVSFLTDPAEYKKERTIFASCPEIPVYIAPKEVMAEIPGFQLTRGTLSLMRRKKLPTAEALCKGAERIAVLEEVVNPANVGAIFRSAAALGVDAVLLTSGCSDPLYRRSARVSMGNVFQIPWAWIPQENYLQLLKDHGFMTVAMALREDSLALDDPKLSGIDRLAIILGTEGEGLKASTITECDVTVRIPMTNEVDSLNVAAASAVAFWELCRKRN